MNRVTILLTTLIALSLSVRTLPIDRSVIAHNQTYNGCKPFKTRIKRMKSRVCYYANSDATFNIVLSGDIESNPGPAPKCTECDKGVGTNRKRLQCTKCLSFTHATCSTISKFQQSRMNSHTVVEWTCPNCTLSLLPFFTTRNIDFNQTSPYDDLNDSLPDQDIHTQSLNQHKNRISIAHLNTQSLLPSITEFSTLAYKYNLDIYTISESWLKDNAKQVSLAKLDGYELFYKNRNGKRGGGVAIYVKDTITCHERKDLSKNHKDLEVIIVEAKGRNKNSSYLIVTVYQPSSKENDKLPWLEKFDKLITDLNVRWNGPIFLAGDTNIDLLGDVKESTRRYKNILYSMNMKQHITKPTRKEKTLIDHISSNIPNKILHNDVIYADEVSDHDMPYIIVNIKKERFEPRYKFIRDEKNFNSNLYKADFKQLPLSLIYSFDDPDDQISILNKLICDCIESHAPLKRVRMTRPIAPWMKDPKIIRGRNFLEHARTNKSKDSAESITHYKETLKWYKKTVKQIKNDFLRKALSSRNPSIIWRTIDRILTKQNNKINHEPADMNSYYCNLASNLTNKVNEPTNYDEIFNDLNPNIQNSFIIRHTNCDEVSNILKKLKNDCSSGYDNLPVRYLKPVSEHLVSPLVNIINNAIDRKTFPDAWKVARVSPVPKIDQPTKLKDYRPISILPVLSKVYERVILYQLCDFIEKNAVYRPNQSGFRKGHTTTTLLLKLRDDIFKAMNTSEVTLSILIDYSKAFDTIDHGTLLRKLKAMNFDISSLKIIASYLSNRRQFVQVNDKKSPTLPIHFGVPQGSILGPVLFNLYVTYLSDQISSHSIQYADDTTLYRHSKIRQILQCIQEIESDIATLDTWSTEHNLLFNPDKLQYIIFSTRQLAAYHKFCIDYSYRICCSKKSIEQKDVVKLLGINFDKNLTWCDHINQIIKSSHATIRALRNFQRFTPYSVRKSLAEALVLSKINYSNVVFGQLPDYLLNRLQRIQNIAAGYVLNRYAKPEDVVNLHWLPIKENIDFNVCKLVHKALNDEAWPSYLDITKVPKSREMRSNDDGVKIAHGLPKTFQDQAKVFNLLPKCTRELKEHKRFIKESKSFFKNKACNRVIGT